jgi:aryl-alcohol dehydrogenase-like predicted oxidoreductase
MIPSQPFGKTGHESTRTIFGAAALSQVSQEDADRTLQVLLEYGVNHIDVAASYGDAELRVGPWMREYRDHFFLATKTGERSYAGARDEIRRSLERLRVEYVDLIQLHNLVDPIEWDQAMGPDGALRAAIEAKEEGLVRAIGVTGHGTPIAAMHMRSLQRFAFDSVLLPYSWIAVQEEKYAQDFEALMQMCQAAGTAVQTIKAIAARPWGEAQHTHATWYAPLTEPGAIDWAVHWVLRRPGIFLNTAGDISLLPRILDAASRFNAVHDVSAEPPANLTLEPIFV